MMPMATDPWSSEEPALMIEINTTPLIDVLLVLLVMLIITIPVQLHAVNIALPVRAGATTAGLAQAVEIHIDAADRIVWQGVTVDQAGLDRRMADVALQETPPALHVRPDRACSYAVFAHVLAASRRHGLNRVAVLGGEQFR